MIIRRLLFTALRMAAQNPEVRKQATMARDAALEAARPTLLKASRRAGQAVRSAHDEVKEGVKQFKDNLQGEAEIIPPNRPKSKKKPAQDNGPKNITPKK